MDVWDSLHVHLCNYFFRLEINLIYSSQVWVYIVCMGEWRTDRKVELHTHDTNVCFFSLQIKTYSVTFKMLDIYVFIWNF